MRSATQLRTELREFLDGKRFKVFSEIESLLYDLDDYLAKQENPHAKKEDPTIASQMNLDWNDTEVQGWKALQMGNLEKSMDTGEVRERPDYTHMSDHPDHGRW